MNYSPATLKWGLEVCHDRDVADGVAPFSRTSLSWWASTSGHHPEAVKQIMDEVALDRSTRAMNAGQGGEGK